MIEERIDGYLVSDCAKRCLYDRRASPRLGIDAFHHHANALAEARARNKRAGGKVFMVVVRDGHFMVQ